MQAKQNKITRNVSQCDKCPQRHDFLKLRPEVKVTVTQRQYATLHNPKVYPHTKFGIPTSNNI